MKIEGASPKVTFALFSYNQENYISDAVRSVLAQEYAPLELIISDDCSKDSTYKIIESIVAEYDGPHKVILNRNPVNFGLAKHFSKIMGMSSGEIIVVGAGDDISFKDRVVKTVRLFEENKDATMVSFTDSIIDEQGRVIKKPRMNKRSRLRKFSLEDYIGLKSFHFSGASRAYKRCIAEFFGDLNSKCPTEDTPFALRGLMLGTALISPDPGIYYRRHTNNLSGQSSLHSMPIEEIHLQYSSDCEIAKQKGLISDQTYSLLSNWIERNYLKRLLLRGLYQSTSKGDFFFRNVLFNKTFSSIEKIRALRSVFR